MRDCAVAERLVAFDAVRVFLRILVEAGGRLLPPAMEQVQVRHEVGCLIAPRGVGMVARDQRHSGDGLVVLIGSGKSPGGVKRVLHRVWTAYGGAFVEHARCFETPTARL